MVDDKILSAREKRREIVGQMSETSDVVTAKANVPGWNKNIPQAVALVKHFARILQDYGVYEIRLEESADGVTLFGRVEDGRAFKERAVGIEKAHPLGRLIDIDVTLRGEEKSLSRGEMRKCFLCDNSAFVCARAGAHDTGELLSFFVNKTDEYISELIEGIIEESMLAELNIENKFGLVTPTSNGSHSDLNYRIMSDAIRAIKKPLAQAFKVGLVSAKESEIMQKLIPIGVSCEIEMNKKTNGANAYKGFIFVGGIILAGLGFCVRNGLGCGTLSQINARICEDYSFPTDTFGGRAYKNGFGGIRESAKLGFVIVEQAAELIGKVALDEILTFIVDNISDSVLLKRAGSAERYDYFKRLIVGAPKDGQRRADITGECIRNNISIGGSADILICAVMYDKIKESFYL